MSLILFTSITLRLMALIWSIILFWRLSDYRMLFFTLMLGLMALRQVLTLSGTLPSSVEFTFDWHDPELPGLIVSAMAFLSVHFIYKVITDRRKAEEALCKIYDIPSSLIMIIDSSGIICKASSGWHELMGYQPEVLQGRLWTEFIHKEDPPLPLVSAGNPKYSHNIENRFLNADGDYRSLSWWFSHDNQSGYYYTYAQDITDRNEANALLAHQASHDALTNLINRREFEQQAIDLISDAKRNASEHALCFIDLDQFKIINDTCGHSAGDEVLKQLADLLSQHIRKRDLLARLGGDEFGVLIANCSTHQAMKVAEHLLNTIGNFHFCWNQQSFKLGASIGLVSITETTTNLTELMMQADTSCYIAKDRGRNQIHTSPIADVDVARRQHEMQWVPRLTKALSNNLFELYGQPIYPSHGNDIVHNEVLLRLRNENGELVLPGAFLPAAERYNLIVEIDHWVIRQTLALLAQHRHFLTGPHRCSINLSGQTLLAPGLYDLVLQLTQQYNIAAEKICFEITETAVISNLSSASRLIRDLKQVGFHFALDDFGTGQSSLTYLKHLPVDYLKIDGMFVRDILDDPLDFTMVKYIHEIGRLMGMKTVAEYVESEAIKIKLQEIGIDYLQGYGICEPMPLSQCLNMNDPAQSIAALDKS